MSLSWFRSVARRVFPRAAPNGRLGPEAEKLFRRAARCRGLEEQVDLIREHPLFFSLQKRGEILGMLRMVEEVRPARVCEIGSQQGGTLFLLSRVIPPGSAILSLDIDHTPACRAIADRISRTHPVTCLTADSHSPRTLEEVRGWLDGGELEFLFIDGDHSYAGVKQDYETYGPLVCDGGLFAFHDINPLRSGAPNPTGADPGEVPKFWAESKSRWADYREFVEDPSEGGYGIAVVRKTAG